MNPVTLNTPIMGRVDRAVMWFWSRLVWLWNRATGRDNFSLSFLFYVTGAGFFAVKSPFYAALWVSFAGLRYLYILSLRRTISDTDKPILDFSITIILWVRVYWTAAFIMCAAGQSWRVALGNLFLSGSEYALTCFVNKRKSWAKSLLEAVTKAVKTAAAWRPSMPPVPIPIPIRA